MNTESVIFFNLLFVIIDDTRYHQVSVPQNNVDIISNNIDPAEQFWKTGNLLGHVYITHPLSFAPFHQPIATIPSSILSLVQLRRVLSSSYVQIKVCVQFHLSSRGQLEMALCASAQGGVRNQEARARGRRSACPRAHFLHLTGPQPFQPLVGKESGGSKLFPSYNLSLPSLILCQAEGSLMDKKPSGRVQISNLEKRSLTVPGAAVRASEVLGLVPPTHRPGPCAVLPGLTC